MAGILDWRSAGVDLKVEVATTKDLVVRADITDLAFQSGGSEGAPLGWVPVYVGGATTADIDFTTSAGVYGAYAITSPGTTGGVELVRYFTALANRRYQLQIENRAMPGKSESARYIELAEYNPSTTASNVLGSTSFLNISNTNFEGASVQASRAVNIAGGFTQLRVRIRALAENGATGNRQWGVEFRKPFLLARELAMPTIDWRDITCDVKSLDIRYGRERFTNRYDVATMQLVLSNQEGEYHYAEPHPFNFGPGRAIRASATLDGVSYPLSYCIIDQINDGQDVDGRAVTNVNAVDVTTIGANRSTPGTSPSFGGGGLRIDWLLDVLGYYHRSLDGGNFMMKPITASGRTIRDEMGVTADSEGSSLFADREGRFVYKDRDWRNEDDNLKSVTANLWAKPHSDQPYFDGTPDQAGLPTICLNRVVTDWGMSRVVNEVSLANAGGDAQQYYDFDSQREHGTRTYQRHDFVNQFSSYLDIRAADIMTGYTQPKMRLTSVSYRPGVDGNDWRWTLRVFLNWLVRVWYQNLKTGWGWLTVTHVQSVEHHITPTEWVTTMALDLPTYFADAPVTHVLAWDAPASKWDTTGVWA